jgi:hypothetical protein
MLFVKPDPKQILRVLLDPTEDLFVHLGDTSGSFQETLAPRILADGFYHHPHGFFDLGFVHHEYLL